MCGKTCQMKLADCGHPLMICPQCAEGIEPVALVRCEACDKEREKMESFHVYKDPSDVEIGDVVTMRQSVEQGIGYNGFMTSIIEDIDTEHGLAYLCRPHVRVHKIGCTSGTAFVGCERYAVELNVMVRRFICFTNGTRGEKDNRGDVK
jgi:hypothetical protein